MLANRSLETAALLTFLLAIGFCARIDPALTQTLTDDDAVVVIEEVVVVASLESRLPESRPATGYRTETVAMKQIVTYADLDLMFHDDVMELRRRIETSARDACEALEKAFPLGQKDTADIHRCTQRAIEGAEDDLQVAVAAAN
jgi:UrcA family protein